jgi:hypothetical protein
MTGDDFIGLLLHLQVRLPQMNVWQIHSTYFKRVCPRAFYDDVMDALMAGESAAAEYKGAMGPLSTGSTREQLLGFPISYRDLISAFDIIRAVKNEFKRMDMEEAEAQSQKGGSPTSRASSTGGRPQKVMGG